MEDNGATSPHQEEYVPLLVSMEDLIEKSIGPINCTQIVQAILASIPIFFDSLQTFISVFTHVQPTWHCTTTNCSSSSDICSLSKSEWAWDSENVYTSIISEWNLECANPVFLGLPTSCFFVGCMFGGLVLATLSDSSLGRKNLLVMSSLVMSLLSLASAFSPNIWVYSGSRFLSGVGCGPIAISSVVLLAEKVGKQWRGLVAMLSFVPFSFGLLALTGIAYITRVSSWRTLYLWTSIPGILGSIVCYLFLCESPRWLFMQGRQRDAINVLRRIGSSNPIGSISPDMLLFTQQKIVLSSCDPFESIKILFERRWARNRLLASMVLSLGIGPLYFGMFLGVENLGFNIYMTSVFNALLLLSSYLLTFPFWIQRCNRRTSLLGFCTISGVTCIIFSILGKSNDGFSTELELVSLFCASMAYNIVAMYVLELFPTCVRNTTSLLVRQAMILGSVFDLMLIQLGKKNMMYSYTVFGLAMLLSGFIVLYLPETKGKVLCDTIEEQELRDSCSKSIEI